MRMGVCSGGAFAGCLIAASLPCMAGAPPAIGGDPSVRPTDFRVTTFASGLNYPTGMQQLSDGSILVGVSTPNVGGNYFVSTGQLLRLVDANHDGVADTRQVLADNLPGGITSVRQAGSLVFVSSGGNANPSITVLRNGPTPSDPYTNLGSINFNFPTGWEHTSYALAVRPTPGTLSSFDLFFNVGSQANFADTPASVTVSTSGLLTSTLQGDSIYKTTVSANGSRPVFSTPVQVASGLRNAAGIAFHPTTHDLYFEDNGIDDATNEELSADELNVLPAAQIGQGVPNYGFAHDYIEYRTGRRVGSGAVQPVIAFQPSPDPNTGSESAGANEITFAPPNFPTGLNTGVFVGFHGEFDSVDAANGENPLVYADPQTGKYFHFMENRQAGLGHPDGLLATTDSLFVADLSDASLFGAPFQSGSIFQVESLTHLAIYGDFDGDGTVDFKDLLILAQHYGQQDAGLSGGDADGDGTVDFNDLLILAQNYGQNVSTISPAQRPVPEPGVAAAVAMLCAASMRRRRTIDDWSSHLRRQQR